MRYSSVNSYKLKKLITIYLSLYAFLFEISYNSSNLFVCVMTLTCTWTAAHSTHLCMHINLRRYNCTWVITSIKACYGGAQGTLKMTANDSSGMVCLYWSHFSFMSSCEDEVTHGLWCSRYGIMYTRVLKKNIWQQLHFQQCVADFSALHWIW